MSHKIKMSFINQNFHGDINHLNIQNISNITRQGNTSDASHQNSYPPNQANSYRGAAETRNRNSVHTTRSSSSDDHILHKRKPAEANIYRGASETGNLSSVHSTRSNSSDVCVLTQRNLANGTSQLVKRVAAIVRESDEFLYCLDPGNVLIINNEYFSKLSGLSRRIGSEEDVKALDKLFVEVLRWEKPHVCQNLTVDAIKTKLDFYTKFHYNGINSFFLFIMSHGTEEGIYGVNGGIIKCETVLHYFSATNCPGLANKPKIFVFQACRGNMDDNGVTIQTDNYSSNASKMITIPNMSDFLVLYPCVPGYTALRIEQRGTLFIQALVHFIEKYCQWDPLLKILIKVNQNMAHNENQLAIKMMPCLDQRLSMKCYFKSWFKSILSQAELS